MKTDPTKALSVVWNRLDELKALPPGWLCGEGSPITPNVCNFVGYLLGQWILLTPEDALPKFYLYPMLSGGIQVALDYSDGRDIEIEFCNNREIDISILVKDVEHTLNLAWNDNNKDDILDEILLFLV